MTETPALHPCCLFVSRLILTLGLLLGAAQAVTAQGRSEPFRLQLHIAAEEAVKAAASGYLTAALRPVSDLEITDRNPDLILSLVILPVTNGGYAISTIVMRIYSDRALEDVSNRWDLTAATRDRFRAMFKGAGALLDQRVVTGPDLKMLCDDAAGALNADILARERRFRRQP